jgi:hypothetical protein
MHRRSQDSLNVFSTKVPDIKKVAPYIGDESLSKDEEDFLNKF